MNSLLQWLASALSDGSSGLPSIKRLGFFLIVCCMTSLFCGVLLGMTGLTLYWLPVKESYAAMKLIMDAFMQLMFYAICAVTSGYVGGKMVEKIPSKRKDDGVSTDESPDPKGD